MWVKISLEDQNLQLLIEKYETAKAELINALQRESLVVGEKNSLPPAATSERPDEVDTKKHLDQAIIYLANAYKDVYPAERIASLVDSLGTSLAKKFRNHKRIKISACCNEAATKAFLYTTGKLPGMVQSYRVDDEIGDYETIIVCDDLEFNQAIEFSLRRSMEKFDPHLDRQFQIDK